MFFLKKIQKNKGFVILLASLMASSFLIIGASIFTISLKEIILSSGDRESQHAFFAADSAVECATYWDLQGGVFATSSFSGPEPAVVYCNNQDITANTGWVWKNPSETTDDSSQTIFTLNMFPENPDRKDCAVVVVDKVSERTYIEARGYNSCDPDNPRRVERGLRVSY